MLELKAVDVVDIMFPMFAIQVTSTWRKTETFYHQEAIKITICEALVEHHSFPIICMRTIDGKIGRGIQNNGNSFAIEQRE